MTSNRAACWVPIPRHCSRCGVPLDEPDELEIDAGHLLFEKLHSSPELWQGEPVAGGMEDAAT